jgi:hypothetical protein
MVAQTDQKIGGGDSRCTHGNSSVTLVGGVIFSIQTGLLQPQSCFVAGHLDRLYSEITQTLCVNMLFERQVGRPVRGKFAV